jgi:hypothetical protein
MTKRCLIKRLSLSQRERMEVRDCSRRVFQALTKLPGERYRVLPGPDDSKSERRQCLVSPKIPLVPGRVFCEGDNHGLNHPVRQQASRPDNRNPGCKRRWDAVVEICTVRSFDSADDAREYVRSRSRFCGGNGRESLAGDLVVGIACEKTKREPLTSILSPQPGRGGSESSKQFDVRGSADD